MRLIQNKGGEKMPILDSIQTAEKKAEQMRHEANEKVKILLEETKTQSAEQVKQMHGEAILEEKKIHQDSFKLLENKEKEILAQTEKEIQDFSLKAEGRMNKAVNTIIKKVFEI